MIAATAATAEPPRQTASYALTSTAPGTATGFTFAVDWRNPEDPEGKPYSVARFSIRFPEGARYDGTAIPQCHASDAELMAMGAAACPPGSRVGAGTLETDTGSPAVIPRFSDNVVTQFNGDGEIIGLAETSEPPTRVVSRSKLGEDGRTLTTDVPAIPGNPPPDNYLAFRTLRLAGPAITGEGGRPVARTPPACPAEGAWTTLLSFTYRDGVTQEVESRSPCDTRQRERIVLSVRPRRVRAGVPTLLRFRTRTPAGEPLSGVTVHVGKRVKRTGPKGRARMRYTFQRFRGFRHARATKPGLERALARIRVAGPVASRR